MDRISASKTDRVDDYRRFSPKVTHEPLSINQLFPIETEDPLPDQKIDFQLRQAKRQLEQISDAAQAFTLQLDFDSLLVDIARYGHEILRADRVIVHSNHDNQLKAAVQFPDSQSIPQVSADALWCVRYLKPRVSNDQPTPDVRNSVCVPMISTQNRVLGIIEAINKRTGGRFNDHDVRVANCLGRVAASAVDRARLFFRIEEWKQSIETLLSFNATVNQQLEPTELVHQLVANVTGFLNAAGGAAGIVIQTEDGIITQSDSFYFEGRWYPCPRQWKPGEGIPGIVLKTEFPFLVNNYQTNRLADPALKEFDIGSCICVPIKNAHEEVLGFFKLHRRSGEPEFTWQDAAFLESLGNTAAVAIENARLVKSLELKNNQIKSLSQNHVRQLEQERQHIARELHDETGQVLIGLKLRLQVLGGLLNDQQGEAKQELSLLQANLNEATVQLKDLAKRLRPPTLDELGFEASLLQLVSEYRQNADFKIRVDFQSDPVLTGESETAFYRIAQESLTNIAKHSKADRVEITFANQDQQQWFCIRDNGQGFDTQRETHGLGLMGIKERIKMLNGKINIHSSPGNGTTIEVSLARPDTT